MADDNLKLDIIVDEHGSTKVLADVDAGVNKVVGSAAQGAPQVEKLSGSFLGMSGNVAKLAAGLGVAIPVLTFLSTQLRAAADDARKFSDAAKDLESDAQRIQALTNAAEDNRVGFDQMVGGLTRLQQHIGSGKLNDELRELHINLDAFRQEDITEQFLQINAALAAIEDPLDRAAMKARLFGGDAKEMGRLAQEGFRDAVDGATTMRDETIAAMADIDREFDRVVAELSRKSKSLVAEASIGFLNLMGRSAWQEAGKGAGTPDLPSRPGGGPEPLPTMRAPSPDTLKSLLVTDMEASLQREAIEEANFAMDAYLRKIGQVTAFVPEFMAIHEAEVQLAKQGEAWADVLETNVGGAVDRINAKLVDAVVKNTQLTGEAQSNRDRLMSKLTSTSNPNESEYDRQFNAIDQEHKTKMAGVDQNDRTSAAILENAILEETNLKVQELQEHWEGVLSKQAGAITGADTLRKSYDELNQSFQPKGGTALPGGLVMPTAEQVATGRYFGPVTPNGQPDPARMGGASPVTNNWTLNAQGALLDSPGALDVLVRKIEDLQAQRDASRGGQVRR